MKTVESEGEEHKNLDLAMAALFTGPTTKSTLDFARKVRALELNHKRYSKDEQEMIRSMYSDAMSLHHAILVFETDPELVSQNALARILSTLTPALLSLEEYLSGEDVNFWEILIDGTAVASHMVSTTPYVTGARLTVDFHFQEDLVKIEERLTKLFYANGQNVNESINRAIEICDELRQKNLNDSAKPAYIFLFWYCIVIISYKNFRDHFQKK
jgi:hypothetical protein